jgi:hypothetical protein
VLKHAYTFLSKISPASVLLGYLALIPLFGVLYCVLPGQNFYAPYARMEPLALVDAATVKRNITASMVSSYRGHESSSGGWEIARSDIKTDDLATESSDALRFVVYFFAMKHEDGRITASTGGPQFTVRLSQKKIVTEKRPGWMVCHLVAVPEEQAELAPVLFNRHLLFHPPEVPIQADAVCWGAAEEVSFQNLLAGWSGDPRALSGFGWRMAYFSATTITTVGFGDIVPITAVARALTGIEAIAGWVLAGLFLNSLASRIAAGKQSP